MFQSTLSKILLCKLLFLRRTLFRWQGSKLDVAKGRGEGREVYIQLEVCVEVTLQFLAMKISM